MALQNSTKSPRILQASVVGLYTTYLVLSAIGSQPVTADFNCKPPSLNATLDNITLYGGIAITFIALGYAAFSSGSSSSSFGAVYSSDEFLDDGEKDEENATKYSKLRTSRSVGDPIFDVAAFNLQITPFSMLFLRWRLATWPWSSPTGRPLPPAIPALALQKSRSRWTMDSGRHGPRCVAWTFMFSVLCSDG
jgi:hypothetical protein